MFIVKLAGAAAGAFAGDYVAENFILRDSDDSPNGFITKSPGLGLDDAFRYSLIAIGAFAGMWVVGKVKGG